jgi:hypothetical protein
MSIVLLNLFDTILLHLNRVYPIDTLCGASINVQLAGLAQNSSYNSTREIAAQLAPK